MLKTLKRWIEETIEKMYADHPDATVLLEQYLAGEEASVMALFNGEKRVVLPLLFRITSGVLPMIAVLIQAGWGRFSPLPQFNDDQVTAAHQLVDATFEKGMQADGLDGQGVMYIGLIFTPDGPEKFWNITCVLAIQKRKSCCRKSQNDFYQLISDLLANRQETLV